MLNHSSSNLNTTEDTEINPKTQTSRNPNPSPCLAASLHFFLCCLSPTVCTMLIVQTLLTRNQGDIHCGELYYQDDRLNTDIVHLKLAFACAFTGLFASCLSPVNLWHWLRYIEPQAPMSKPMIFINLLFTVMNVMELSTFPLAAYFIYQAATTTDAPYFGEAELIDQAQEFCDGHHANNEAMFDQFAKEIQDSWHEQYVFAFKYTFTIAALLAFGLTSAVKGCAHLASYVPETPSSDEESQIAGYGSMFNTTVDAKGDGFTSPESPQNKPLDRTFKKI